ncbi:hypothetical protein BKA67DRAFT_593316 [Truncatella angustata]|uniref:Protein kinase domain-containing protein n=1 Tax=Truncatella angustata TaxID=152316 RepID=A0A9P8ZXW3_9PEZI|nr:uncharacterized protein BKA67DRAFT_593316 [Truncatella angustata]KAH6653433.1 hypothetical protein BKA67DRAFT_593316 [Truncatella angustata]
MSSHELVASHFAVETDKELTSKGPITNPLNKLCLKNLRPWPDFLEQQRTTLGALYGTFPVSDRRFESRGFLTSLGQRIAKRPISCEKTLEYFLHNSVEDPVREIFDQLRDVDQNHPNVISDVAEEVVDRQASSIPPQTPDQGKDPGRIRPNQSCVYQFDDELSTRRTMLYVSKYKAPHKLTAPYLRVGLHPMDIFKDVTYNYMIEGGLEYGLLTTGETIVFLRVDWREPGTLFAIGEHHACTAVGQYLAFSLMALGPPGNPPNVRSQDERQRVILGLRRWAEDFETTLRSIPRDERYAPSGSSSGSLYAPTTYAGISRSPRVPRTRPKRWAQEEDCPDLQPRFRDRDDESSSDESLPPMPDTPTPSEPRSSTHSGRAPRREASQERQYCTQRCHLGLVRRGRLDANCPNVLLHWQANLAAADHLIDRDEFLRLLFQQLQESLDHGISRLDVGGSRGVLFKISLMAYGYTFVAKGTVSALDLRDMGRIYYYDHRVYIEYLLLLSHGSPIDEAVRAGEVKRCLRAIHRVCVVHRDVRRTNVLRNTDTGELMLIDFERSVVKAGRKPLGNIVPNKRSWNGQRKGTTASMYSHVPGDANYEEDILQAGTHVPAGMAASFKTVPTSG